MTTLENFDGSYLLASKGNEDTKQFSCMFNAGKKKKQERKSTFPRNVKGGKGMFYLVNPVLCNCGIWSDNYKNRAEENMGEDWRKKEQIKAWKVHTWAPK